MSYDNFKSRLMDLKYFNRERKYANELVYDGEIPERSSYVLIMMRIDFST
ncbi:hypothetical protein OESDEN_00606 [Oesophagostomum dentatum]|uniref:Uncharacterized protein n=1 Tax=Oesophagostomum dentatum TaxID=61180 RepID=A0A0B1TP78_OESDE|nr:hypothetical protein OESDEN_00606 [Oesophagostomum dentatum]